MKSWEEIFNLEINGQYSVAIEAIEGRLKSDPEEKESVIRLGFLYWLGLCQDIELHLGIHFQQYTERFRELLNTYQSAFKDNADFCFSYGLALSLDYYHFAIDGTNAKELNFYKSMGEALYKNAMKLDQFYMKLSKGKASQGEIADHFANRGCFLRYYAPELAIKFQNSDRRS